MTAKPSKCPTCGRAMNQRSNAQNRSMFGIPYKMLADAMSESWGEVVTTKQVHELMKDRFHDLLQEYRIDERYVRLVNKQTGETEEVERPASTAKLTTVGAMRYYEALQKFGAEYFGINIQSPNEQDYSRIETNRRNK